MASWEGQGFNAPGVTSSSVGQESVSKSPHLLIPQSMCGCSVAPSWLALCNSMDWLLCPWDFPGKNTGVGCYFLPQGIFPSQGLKPSLLHLLHWQAESSLLSCLGSPPYPLNGTIPRCLTSSFPCDVPRGHIPSQLCIQILGSAFGETTGQRSLHHLSAVGSKR